MRAMLESLVLTVGLYSCGATYDSTMKQSREPTANVEYHKLFGKIVGAHVIFPNGTVCEYDGSVVQQLQHFELIIDCIHPYNSKARKRIYRR